MSKSLPVLPWLMLAACGAVPAPAPGPPTTDARGAEYLERGTAWSCSFPEEADKKSIDNALVVLQALIAPNGRVEKVRLLAEPGDGFGDAAASCVFAAPFVPARDAQGTPIMAWTKPIRIRFSR